MNLRIRQLFLLWPLLVLLIAGCQASVPQEEHDRVLADLTAAETEVQRLESDLAAAELQLRELQGKVEEAVLAAEILDGLVKAALGAEDLTDEQAIQLFVELSSKLEESDDAILKEKFQAVVLSFGGQEEAIELVQYLIEVIGELGAGS